MWNKNANVLVVGLSYSPREHKIPMKKVKCTQIWHPFHSLQDIVSSICNTYNSLPES